MLNHIKLHQPNKIAISEFGTNLDSYTTHMFTWAHKTYHDPYLEKCITIFPIILCSSTILKWWRCENLKIENFEIMIPKTLRLYDFFPMYINSTM
jgi:hypothetical protein